MNKLLYLFFPFQAIDILKLHREACPCNHKNLVVDFSLDGVQEANSSNVSMDIYCLRFHGCRSVYPLRLIKPYDRYRYDEQEEIRNVISDINEAGIEIDTGVFDKPKRSVVQLVKSSAARHPCEYCECPAVNYIDNTMKKTMLTWPPTTMNGRPRTITAIRRIVNSIEEGDQEVLTNDYLRGIKGRSVLLDQPNFDIIMDVPTEYMHIVCLGTVKRLIEFTYNVGKKRDRITTRPRCNPKLFNDLIKLISNPREFSRRCRNLDTAIYKAQEYRNILLFYFPIILENIPEAYKKERQLWLALVFMVRACVIPNEEFDNVSNDTIINACELFFNLYFELFGQKNCTYSIHVVSSHILKMRGNVPFTERSAFPFESFYSEMKQMFKPGTQSTLQQILKNTLMKRKLEYHACHKKIYYSKENTKESMENNSHIYTYRDKKYDFYVINEINEGVYTCRRQGRFEFKSSLIPNYDWKSVGVFKRGPVGSKIFHINENEIKEKGIYVLNMLVTCPINVLRES